MKRILTGIILLSMLLALSGCCLRHEWMVATCTNPMTCVKCGKTEGSALGHTWEDATCTVPKTCSVCKETMGEALGHTAGEATCTEAAVCSDCGETVSDALGHSPSEATCTADSVCTVCSEVISKALGHSWIDATYEAPKTCTTCGETEGEPLKSMTGDLGIDYDVYEKLLTTALGNNGYGLKYEGLIDGSPYYKVTQNGYDQEVTVAFELLPGTNRVRSFTVYTSKLMQNQTFITGYVGGVAMAISDITITEDVIQSMLTDPIEINGVLVYSMERNGLLHSMIVSSELLALTIEPIE